MEQAAKEAARLFDEGRKKNTPDYLNAIVAKAIGQTCYRSDAQIRAWNLRQMEERSLYMHNPYADIAAKAQMQDAYNALPVGGILTEQHIGMWVFRTRPMLFGVHEVYTFDCCRSTITRMKLVSLNPLVVASYFFLRSAKEWIFQFNFDHFPNEHWVALPWEDTTDEGCNHPDLLAITAFYEKYMDLERSIRHQRLPQDVC